MRSPIIQVRNKKQRHVRWVQSSRLRKRVKTFYFMRDNGNAGELTTYRRYLLDCSNKWITYTHTLTRLPKANQGDLSGVYNEIKS